MNTVSSEETPDLSGTTNDLSRVTSNGAPDVRSGEMSTETSEAFATRDQAMPIRALIVDDEPLARKRIYDLLRSAGSQPEEERNATAREIWRIAIFPNSMRS